MNYYYFQQILYLFQPYSICHNFPKVFLHVADGQLLGTSVRNSAHGKGHEEGGFGIHKGGSREPQETPCSRASTPKTRVYLLYCFMHSPIPLTLRGADPITSLGEGVNLQLQVNKNSWA